ncbi:MAG: ribonuclease Y [Bacteriovoracaceae bacterium]
MAIELVLASILCLILGSGIGYVIRNKKAENDRIKREKEGQDIIEKAKKDGEEILNAAKREAKQFVRDEKEIFEKDVRKKVKEITDQEKAVAKKELLLDQKKDEYEKEKERIKLKENDIDENRRKITIEQEKVKQKQIELAEKLTKVSEMTRDQAKAELLKTIEEEAKLDSAKLVRKIEEEAKEEAEKKSKRIIGIAIQRFAGEYVSEKTITAVELPSDDVKGRLIGREGRNIRAFEQICGVDLLIDDTPEIVVISSFNVVRREIARLVINKLIADGRIHPAKVEEFYEKSKIEFEAKLKELGEKAQMEIGVHGIHPEILKLVGALNWRTSYTQNQYQHAIEAAFICGSMAAELGMNVKQARRAGLLHDIGKVLDASAEGSHAVIGAEFAKKYGESPDVVHAIRAHHDDEKPESVLAHLVAAADALSGARPGARKAMMESYVSRLTDMEDIVNSFPGVNRSYALSAGREVRVLVENDKVTDEQVIILSRDIAKKIEEEMSYPGTVKVTVLRETKAISIAK